MKVGVWMKMKEKGITLNRGAELDDGRELLCALHSDRVATYINVQVLKGLVGEEVAHHAHQRVRRDASVGDAQATSRQDYTMLTLGSPEFRGRRGYTLRLEACSAKWQRWSVSTLSSLLSEISR